MRTGKDERLHVESRAVTPGRVAEPERGIDATPERAVVFVPEGKLQLFFNRLIAYAQETPAKPRERRYENMLDRIRSLQLATLSAFWTDVASEYPKPGQSIWWEVWLRRSDGNELARFRMLAGRAGLRLGDAKPLVFDERIVLLAFGTIEALSCSIDVLDDLAELRRAKELVTFFTESATVEQAAWAMSFAARLKPPSVDAPAVTILDTGVTRGHPLLAPVLAETDMHAVNSSWGTADHDGHGTAMSGLALYGDLREPLLSSFPVAPSHRLESVMILPPPHLKPNDPALYGEVTATAVARPELQAPERLRVFSMAVTADARDRGQPTSWSASIDALAAGRSIEQRPDAIVFLDGVPRPRLLVISAGNVPTAKQERDHLSRSDIETVEDPAQAWNAVSVGAYTDLVGAETGLQGLAAPGELSPHSRTGVGFGVSWPLKPDVVAEGGNAAINDSGDVEHPEALSLLTTSHELPQLYTTANATSAACAQVARMAAMIAAEYPTLWPETLRALVVHSARWTPRMWNALSVAATKQARAALVRRYGFGVPNVTRAIRSAGDALTLISQSEIRPFQEGKLGEMHLHNLPWPLAELQALGETAVQMRVTLSYFIEPNPARRGWRARHRYQSHGLRLEVRRPTEDEEQFLKRINQAARDEDEEVDAAPADREWFLGKQAHDRGSIHTDIWHGTAAALAQRGMIGIYPVSGWWKELPKAKRHDRRVRYALVVSIETPREDIDLWTPVAIAAGVPVEIAT